MAGRKLRSAVVVALLLAGLLVSGRPLIAHAATFTVNNPADTHDLGVATIELSFDRAQQITCERQLMHGEPRASSFLCQQCSA